MDKGLKRRNIDFRVVARGAGHGIIRSGIFRRKGAFGQLRATKRDSGDRWQRRDVGAFHAASKGHAYGNEEHGAHRPNENKISHRWRERALVRISALNSYETSYRNGQRLAAAIG